MNHELSIKSHDSQFDNMTDYIGSSDWLWKGKNLLHGFNNNVFLWNIKMKLLLWNIPSVGGVQAEVDTFSV